jgi:hypothetical protein
MSRISRYDPPGQTLLLLSRQRTRNHRVSLPMVSQSPTRSANSFPESQHRNPKKIGIAIAKGRCSLVDEASKGPATLPCIVAVDAPPPGAGSAFDDRAKPCPQFRYRPLGRTCQYHTGTQSPANPSSWCLRRVRTSCRLRARITILDATIAGVVGIRIACCGRTPFAFPSRSAHLPRRSQFKRVGGHITDTKSPLLESGRRRVVCVHVVRQDRHHVAGQLAHTVVIGSCRSCEGAMQSSGSCRMDTVPIVAAGGVLHATPTSSCFCPMTYQLRRGLEPEFA